MRALALTSFILRVYSFYTPLQVSELSRLLAEDFANVLDDPNLAEVAEAFKGAKGEAAQVQSGVLCVVW